MGGLNSALSIATGALAAQEAGIETVNNNIANANTPGYNREIVNLSSSVTVQSGAIAIGTGVAVSSIASVRDQLLSLRVQQQGSAQAAASAQSQVLSAVEPYFAGAGGSIGTDLSAFFTSLSALSSVPSNTAARQTVISNAQALVSSFHATSAGLTSTQSGLNTRVQGDVQQINSLAKQIAALNVQIGQQSGSGTDGGILTGQRTQLEQQLATLTDISITTTGEGDTVTTGGGTPLVVANRSLPLSTSISTAAGSNGLTQVLDSRGNNITASITGGGLGGILTARDQVIPGFLSQLDGLAYNFAQAFNTAQSTGYDLQGNPGVALFSVPAAVSGSAAAITLSSTNPSNLAVSSDGTAGSNGNLAALTGVQSTAPAGGLNSIDSVASLVSSVGNAAATASTQADALQSSLTQLQNQQSAVSGVSIDEESSNLIRFQQAYQAAAQVVSTIQTLFNSTLNMVSGS